MAAIATADWSEVQATAIMTGSLKEAAEAHGVSYAATRQRAAREAWPVGQRPAKALAEAKAAHAAAVATVTRQPVTNVTSAVRAAVNVHERRRESGKLSMGKYAQRALARAATLPSGKLLAEAQNVKAVAGVYATAYPEKQANPQVMVNLAILGVAPEQVRTVQGE